MQDDTVHGQPAAKLLPGASEGLGILSAVAAAAVTLDVQGSVPWVVGAVASVAALARYRKHGAGVEAMAGSVLCIVAVVTAIIIERPAPPGLAAAVQCMQAALSWGVGLVASLLFMPLARCIWRFPALTCIVLLGSAAALTYARTFLAVPPTHGIPFLASAVDAAASGLVAVATAATAVAFAIPVLERLPGYGPPSD